MQESKSLTSFLNPNPKEISQVFQGSCTPVQIYKKLNRVGEGTYGIVYRAKDTRSGNIVALKRIRMELEQEGMPISSLREIAILKRLNHVNIVRVLDVVVGNGLEHIFMVMEYCEHDLAFLMDNVISKGDGYTPTQVKCLMSQLLSGLAHLHKKYIIHRDLKLSNLLITHAGILKIADFGLARAFGTPLRPMTPRVVTLWYRSPELLYGSKEYTTAIDIWSAGCILGEFLISEPLLPGRVEAHQLALINDLLGSPSERIWPGFSSLPHAGLFKLPRVEYDSLASRFPTTTDATRKLLKCMLMYSPHGRITAVEALASSYFEEFPKACQPMMLPSYPELRNQVDQRIGDAQERADERRKRLKADQIDHF